MSSWLDLPLELLESLLVCCSGWPSVSGPALLALALALAASFRWSCNGGGIIQAAHSPNGNSQRRYDTIIRVKSTPRALEDVSGNQTRWPAEFRFDSHLGSSLTSDVSRGPEVFSMTRGIVVRQRLSLAWPINISTSGSIVLCKKLMTLLNVRVEVVFTFEVSFLV